MGSEMPTIGSCWRHSKTRDEYVVAGLARREHDLSMMVIYRLVGTDGLWVRPLSEWRETVIVNGEPVQRFVWIAGDGDGR